MIKHFKFFVISFLALILFSCSSNVSTTGKIRINLQNHTKARYSDSGYFTEDEVSFYNITLINETSKKTESKIAKPGDDVFFDELTPGTYSVTIIAEWTNNNEPTPRTYITAQGSTRGISVLPGKITSVTVKLQPKNYNAYNAITSWEELNNKILEDCDNAEIESLDYYVSGSITVDDYSYFDGSKPLTIRAAGPVTFDLSGFGSELFSINSESLSLLGSEGQEITIKNASVSPIQISQTGALTCEYVNFTNNNGGAKGGAIAITDEQNETNSVSINIKKCKFTENSTTGSNTYGGAISLKLGETTSKPENFSIEECTFQKNTSTNGGAISIDIMNGSGNAAEINIKNCIFCGNTASEKGGAIFFSGTSSTLNLEGNSVYENHTTSSQSGSIPYQLYGAGLFLNCKTIDWTNNQVYNNTNTTTVSGENTEQKNCNDVYIDSFQPTIINMSGDQNALSTIIIQVKSKDLYTLTTFDSDYNNSPDPWNGKAYNTMVAFITTTSSLNNTNPYFASVNGLDNYIQEYNASANSKPFCILTDKNTISIPDSITILSELEKNNGMLTGIVK